MCLKSVQVNSNKSQIQDSLNGNYLSSSSKFKSSQFSLLYNCDFHFWKLKSQKIAHPKKF